MVPRESRDLNYFVTTFHLDKNENHHNGNHRCVGYFRDLATAEQCVQENWGDIFEYYYMYALIEAVPEGLYQHAKPDRNGQPSKDRWWFRAYKGVDGGWRYARCSQPDWAKSIVGYCFG